MSDDGATIHDRGYRPYDGPRRGVPGAMRSLVGHSVRQALGVRRSIWAKAPPVSLLVLTYLPALAFIGFAAFIPDTTVTENLIPAYSDYYTYIGVLVLLFVAIVGPEVLSPDQRNGMLGMYLASPLSRDTYLISKAAAVFGILAVVTLGPPLFQLIALSLLDQGPGGVVDFAGTLARIAASAVVVAVLFTAVSLAVASFTDRRIVATAAVILVLLILGAVTEVLVFEAGVSPWISAFDVSNVPFDVVNLIWGVPRVSDDLPAAGAIIGYVGWTVAAIAVLRWRYRRLAVTK
jgi:ABC-2 type transport system permease protein